MVVKLTGQPRKRSIAFGVCAVTIGAWRHIGVGNCIFIDFLAGGRDFPRTAPQRLGIEVLKLRGKCFHHFGPRAAQARLRRALVGAAAGDSAAIVKRVFGE